jgi:hypothetical protein
MRERVGGARSERPGRIPIVYALSRLAPGGQAVALGVLVVLLTPCIDYVMCSRAWPVAATGGCWRRHRC